MAKQPQTYTEAVEELRASCGDVLYEVVKTLGVIWLVKRIPGLELRKWVVRREQR